MSRIRTAYHEAGHCVVSHAYKWPVESVALAANGGIVKHNEPPISPDADETDLFHALVHLYAGREAETYAPDAHNRASDNGGEPLTVDQLESLIAPKPEIHDGPSDQDAIDHFASKLNPEKVAEAQRLAAELMMRANVVGQLERIADELLWRGQITGADLEVLLAPS